MLKRMGITRLKTMFPSQSELQRMVEWWVVHTEFQNAKIKIEERMVDNDVKFMLPKVWIQFLGLPAHLCDYLIIWVAGSILGVTKDMDMEFMRCHGISLLLVMVLNPNLIPQTVNIVIGDSQYELKFWVEMSEEAGAPHLMDIDDNHEAGGSSQKEDQGNNSIGKNLMKGSKNGSGGTATGGYMLNQGAGQPAPKSVPLFIVQAPWVLRRMRVLRWPQESWEVIKLRFWIF
jgi:hypothetical protein